MDDVHDLFNFDIDPKDNAPTAVDIDAIFEDAENDPELSYKPLAPSLDLDALRREADARHAKTVVPLIPTSTSVLPNSSVIGGNNTEKGEDEGEKKEKRTRFKLDEGALLGSNGFPKLIMDTKHFKPKGKGHEATDLNRILQIYQFWTHKMFPKTQFRDTVERVEKLCHSKRMQVALSVWRDEARGIFPKSQDADDIGSASDEDQPDKSKPDSTMQDGQPNHHASRSRPSSEAVSRTSSPPPSSASDTDNVPLDDFDLDAFIREEEERAANLAAQTAALENNRNTYGKGQESEIGLTNDDEMLWEELNALNSGAPPAEIPANPSHIQLQDSAPPANDAPADEDMWDAIREVENAGQPPARKDPPVVPNDDDDWEDMYL